MLPGRFNTFGAGGAILCQFHFSVGVFLCRSMLIFKDIQEWKVFRNWVQDFVFSPSQFNFWSNKAFIQSSPALWCETKRKKIMGIHQDILFSRLSSLEPRQFSLVRQKCIPSPRRSDGLRIRYPQNWIAWLQAKPKPIRLPWILLLLLLNTSSL